jgi:hypothetical protein
MAVMGVPGGSQRPPGFYRIDNTLVMSRRSGASSNLQIAMNGAAVTTGSPVPALAAELRRLPTFGHS